MHIIDGIAVVFSASGVMMLQHSSVKITSFGLGLSIGLLMVAVFALIEFWRRR